MEVQIAGIEPESVVDGPGVRYTVFFQGCEHRCPGCHNQSTWDKAGGRIVDVDEIVKDMLSNPLVTGLTISGGEPFLQAAKLMQLLAKAKNSGFDTWVYTGYTWEELIKWHLDQAPLCGRIFSLIDVLVDGPYMEGKRDLSLLFRGSSNQRLIDVPRTLEKRKVVLWKEDASLSDP